MSSRIHPPPDPLTNAVHLRPLFIQTRLWGLGGPCSRPLPPPNTGIPSPQRDVNAECIAKDPSAYPSRAHAGAHGWANLDMDLQTHSNNLQTKSIFVHCRFTRIPPYLTLPSAGGKSIPS